MMYRQHHAKERLRHVKERILGKRDELTKQVEQFNWLSQRYPAERFEIQLLDYIIDTLLF